MSLIDNFSDNADPVEGAARHLVSMETPRLRLREHLPTDADRLHEMTSKPGFVYYCFDGSRQKVDEFLAEAKRTQKPNSETGFRDNHMLAITLKDTDELIGHVCLERVHYIKGLNYEVNFFVDPGFQSKGYGQEAIINMMHYGFEELGLYAYTVTIHPDNKPSQKVAQISGYQKIADIKMDTLHGTEPRDLFILTRDMFYKMRAQDKKPILMSQLPPPAFLPPSSSPPPAGPSPA